jgi:phosphopantetheinyl transferase
MKYGFSGGKGTAFFHALWEIIAIFAPHTSYCVRNQFFMPIVSDIHPAASVRASLWQITETEEELLEMIRLSGDDTRKLSTLRNPSRRKQWIAVRVLLKEMLHPRTAQIIYNDHGKPCLEPSGGQLISISHTGDYVAVSLSARPVMTGIDIEPFHPRIRRVTQRFLSEKEIKGLSPDPALFELYYYWCSKEALFKLYGFPGVDFRNEIEVEPIEYFCNGKGRGQGTVFLEGNPFSFQLQCIVFEKLMMVVCH